MNELAIFKNQIKVSAFSVDGVISSEQYEDDEPHIVYFNPTFKQEGFDLSVEQLKELIQDLNQVVDQMEALDVALNLNKENEK